jgi:hypothetical protein
LIFDPQLGILATWSDLDAARQMEEVGEHGTGFTEVMGEVIEVTGRFF